MQKFKFFTLAIITMLSVNLAWGADVTSATYVKATSLSDLCVGAKVIIAASGYDFAMSETQNTNNRGQFAITKNGNNATWTTGTTDVEEFTLGKTGDYYTFKDKNNKYIYAASSSSNYLKSQATNDANGEWTISFSNGVASIVSHGTNTRKVMQYNQSSSLFACYASASQKPLAIYVKDGDCSSYTVTAVSNDENLGTVSGTTSITASPEECVGYDNPAYTVTPAGKATVAQSGNTFTVSNVTADVTVTINFAELDKDTYVDNLHGNADIEECGSYEAPSLPDAAKATTGNCDVVHYHFAGWVTRTISTGTPGAPSGMITAGTNMTSNGATYIAVWAKEQ